MTDLPRLLIGGVLSLACTLTANADSGRWERGVDVSASQLDSALDQPFPEADPESVDIPARALELLAARVQALVDNEEIVGGELIVIKNRHTVLREAFGWKDREAEKPLEVDALYCVRSMTKPFVGTAIQMLIDEDRLALDTPVHEILPFFDGPQTSKITIEHLLTHTAGYPFTTITKRLTEYADLSEMAEEVAATKLLFEPGSRFEYSDGGSDTLGAVVAKITGAPPDQFIQQRILDPLAMHDTVTLLAGNDEARARIPAAYSGGTGAWTKHWEPSDPPMFPFFLTSQSLYCTTTDYARFLTLWMDAGRAGDQRLLSSEAVERALAPNQPMSGYPINFEGLDVYYAQQWMVYAKTAGDGSPQRIIFGHSGSDGTHAWAWPELDLMVLFFTQSRGTLAGIGLEAVLQTLLVEQALDDPSLVTRVPSAAELKQIAGMYWDETAQESYYVVTPRGDRLIVERPGKMRLVFKAGQTPGRYVHEAKPEVWIEFVRSDDGSVTAMRTSFGGPVELDPRHVPADDLPSVEDVVALVKQGHHIDRLSQIGVVRMSGTLKIGPTQIEASITSLFDTARGRTEIQVGPAKEIFVFDNGRVWSYSATAGAEELAGERLEQVLLDRSVVRFGDWTEHYQSVEVLKRLQIGDKSVLLVRVEPREAPASTMFIDEANGQVLLTDSLTQIPGLGIVGIRSKYGDFRDVGGMQLPFRTTARFSTELIGRIVTQIEESETGVEVTEETFAAPTSLEK